MDKGLGRSFLDRHRPSMLVLASQLSAAALNGFAKFFETGKDPVHPFQVLFVRFLITGTACTFYLWFTKAPNFPLGLPELRWLLALRAAAGVLGAFGFYFSIMYLKLSEATALNFLGPLTAMILIRYLDYGTFEVIDRIGAFVALIGVILVVQPDALFGSKPTLASAAQSIADGSPKGRMMGFGFGLISVCGGAVALTAIRSIGTRIGGVVTSLIVVSSAKEWKWLRKGRYEVVEQDSLDEREPDEEVVEMRPNSSVA
ncbi:hypothetical protein CSAL01_01410 [Colletotrichum salicis]|uniref:EamA domain-containing protein n=1 Tax=Colletotrichum salicis TaxID=1209931 RepID=A0A135SX53_9PEZI|nr:hypothetical protein CSAL01_01410 [Colletotrichum salicis]